MLCARALCLSHDSVLIYFSCVLVTCAKHTPAVRDLKVEAASKRHATVMRNPKCLARALCSSSYAGYQMSCWLLQVVNVLGFSLPFYRSPTLLLSLGLSVRVLYYLITQRPDVIHVSSPGLLVFAATLYAKLLAIPLVVSSFARHSSSNLLAALPVMEGRAVHDTSVQQTPGLMCLVKPVCTVQSAHRTPQQPSKRLRAAIWVKRVRRCAPCRCRTTRTSGVHPKVHLEGTSGAHVASHPLQYPHGGPHPGPLEDHEGAPLLPASFVGHERGTLVCA